MYTLYTLLYSILLFTVIVSALRPPLPVTTNFTVTYPDNSSIQIFMVGDPTGNILRIISAPPSNNPVPPSFLRYPLEDSANIPPIPSNDGFTVVELPDHYVLTATNSVILVNKSVAVTTITRPDGTVVSQETQAVTPEIPSQCGNGHGGPIPTGCLRAWRTLEYQEQIYGFGDQFTNLNHAGTTKFIRTCANPDSTGITHAPMPFFLSSRGYGIAVNTHVYSYFDIGFAIPPSPTTPGIHMINTADPVMDIYFFMGPDPKSIMNQFTLIYGRTAMPPKWALKLWYHPQEQSNQTEIINVVNNFTNNNIPLAAVTLEPPWQTHAYSCTYVWNNNQIWDPKGMVATLNASGVQTTLWQHAYIYNPAGGLTSPLWNPIHGSGLASNWITWGGAVPDWTLDGTRIAVQSYMQSTFIDIGIAAFKLDECDGTPPGTANDWFFQDNSTFPSGFDGMHMHNLFGLLYGYTYHELFEQNNLRTFLKARATYMGGQRYPTTMYSDSYDYYQYMLAVINTGWSGVTWAPELRDAGNNTEFVRRSQLMFFSGVSSEDGWNTGFQPYPPYVSSDAAAIYQYYYNARMQLVPTLYTAWSVQNSIGYPVVHSLIMDYPNDSLTLSTITNEYSLAGLLVAPCDLFSSSRNVYFPANSGSWVTYFNSSTSPVYNATNNVQIACPDSNLPVFQQLGTLVLLNTFPKSTSFLRLRGIADNERLSYEPTLIYDDDGKTWDYKYKQLYYKASTQFSLVSLNMEMNWEFQTNYTVVHNQYTPEWSHIVYEIIIPSNHKLRDSFTLDNSIIQGTCTVMDMKTELMVRTESITIGKDMNTIDSNTVLDTFSMNTSESLVWYDYELYTVYLAYSLPKDVNHNIICTIARN